jgi:hypothetical protein
MFELTRPIFNIYSGKVQAMTPQHHTGSLAFADKRLQRRKVYAVSSQNDQVMTMQLQPLIPAGAGNAEEEAAAGTDKRKEGGPPATTASPTRVQRGGRPKPPLLRRPYTKVAFRSRRFLQFSNLQLKATIRPAAESRGRNEISRKSRELPKKS